MNDKKMKFIQRPAPVFVEHRPIYKIGQILLILYLSSRGFKSSLTRLQLFNWLIKERVRKDKVILSIKNNKLDVYAWGFDPALTIALRYAIAEKLIDEKIDENSYLFSGRLDVEFLNEKYNFQIPETDSYSTLGGYIVNHTKEIPHNDPR